MHWIAEDAHRASLSARWQVEDQRYMRQDQFMSWVQGHFPVQEGAPNPFYTPPLDGPPPDYFYLSLCEFSIPFPFYLICTIGTLYDLSMGWGEYLSHIISVYICIDMFIYYIEFVLQGYVVEEFLLICPCVKTL